MSKQQPIVILKTSRQEMTVKNKILQQKIICETMGKKLEKINLKFKIAKAFGRGFWNWDYYLFYKAVYTLRIFCGMKITLLSFEEILVLTGTEFLALTKVGILRIMWSGTAVHKTWLETFEVKITSNQTLSIDHLKYIYVETLGSLFLITITPGTLHSSSVQAMGALPTFNSPIEPPFK